MTKLKFCGLRRAEDIAFVNMIRPDYAGFILTDRFWRYVPPKTVKELCRGLVPGIPAVGVVVDEPAEYAAALLNEGVVDILQLHGAESEDYLAAVRALAPGKPLWKAFRVRTAADLALAGASSAGMVLLDSGAGSGEAFDWSLTAGAKRPFLLAGGLTPQNVAAAIRQVHPFAVDVSSGIETDKHKDYEKMKDFAAAVRAEG